MNKKRQISRKVIFIVFFTIILTIYFFTIEVVVKAMPIPEWNYSVNPSGSYDRAYDVTVDSDNNIIVVGYDRNTTGTIEQWRVIKLNPYGDSTWNYTINVSSNHDRAYGVANFSNDNIIVAGYDRNTTSGDYQWRIIELDEDKNVVWENTTNISSGNDAAEAVAVDSENNIIVVGSDRAPASGDSQWRVVKFDKDKVLQWEKEFDPNENENDWVYDVAVDSQNNIIVVGNDKDTIGNDYQWRTMKLNPSGDVLWINTTNPSTGTGIDEARGVAIDSEDNIIVVGNDKAPGEYQWRVIKFNKDKVLQWEKTFNMTNSNDYAYDVAVDSNDNIIVVGSFRNSTSGTDWLIMKLDSDGDFVWNYTTDLSLSTDEARGVAVDSNDNIIVVGYDRKPGNYQWRIMKFRPNLPDGYACTSGYECSGGYCVEGYCRPACSDTYDGDKCSNTTNNYDSDGICTRIDGGWECDKIEASFYNNDYWESCEKTTDGAECDSDSLAGGYSKDGICVKSSSGGGGYTYNGWNFLVGDLETLPDDVKFDGTYFWVIGRGTDNIYKYDSGGTFTGTTIPVGAQESVPTGVEFDGSNFWVIGWGSGLGSGTYPIYRYDSAGNPDGTECTVSESNIREASDISFDGSYFWISDSHIVGTSEVYQYETSSPNCNYINHFSVHSQETLPDGIAVDPNYVYVVGISSDTIYRYTKSGTYDSGWSIYVGGEAGNPMGLDFDGTYFYVVDYTTADNNDRIVRYDPDISYPCDNDEVCYDTTYYWADCSMCSDNDDCDSDVDSSGYSRDGHCQGDGCCLDAAGGGQGAACDVDSDCNIEDECISASGGWRDYNDNSAWDTSTDEDCTLSCTCSQDSTTRDNDLIQTACGNCVGSGRWNIGGDPPGNVNCCGDDSNENTIDSNYDGSLESTPSPTDACCNPGTDCVHSDTCYASGFSYSSVDSDSDTDYCLNNIWYDCYDDGDCQSGQYCESNDCLPHYLTVESTELSYWNPGQGEWITSENGLDVPPLAGDNRLMNVTVIIENSTTVDTCSIRIFNSSDSYSNPTIGPLTGTIWEVGSQIQCYATWNMEYWRNPGGCSGCPGSWNVSVDLSDSVSNFTSKTFTYTKLISTENSVSTIEFNGLPGETVDSANAYPLSMKNTGNVKLDISINGTDFIGETDQSYVVGVENVSYSETESGSYVDLTHDYTLVFSSLNPTEERYLYFRTDIPLGFKAQLYNNTIEIKKVET